jgi:hypothetical protein
MIEGKKKSNIHTVIIADEILFTWENLSFENNKNKKQSRLFIMFECVSRE